MQKIFPLAILFSIFSLTGNAQFTRYIIELKDKGGSPFSLANPLQYLSQRAVDRRVRYNITIDSTDLPVSARYIDSIRLAGNVVILNTSKWLNQVAIETSDAVALDRISNFPFVRNTIAIAARLSDQPVNKQLDPPSTASNLPMLPTQQRVNGYYDYGQSAGQVKIHNGDFLHNHGFRGEGMQMAVLDAGFYHYLSLATFDSMRNDNRVLGTWDFVANEASVDEDNNHGMNCLSTIAANMPGVFVGTAPNTSFYLYRTEDVGSEYPIEEQNWAAGIERADSVGVDISSTSLGYSIFDNSAFNYTYANMDGNTTISARAADMAAKKGILVVSAAGNEGNSSWRYLITPSDADSSLSVGAVNVAGNVAGFSSYGPSGDGQVKPSVAAVGLGAVVANTSNGQPTLSNGTSFACPNMAGIATCLWQAFPEVNNMGVIAALQQSSTKFANPDDRVGHGIPDAKKAFVMLMKSLYSRQFNNTDCNATFGLNIKTDNTMSIMVERKLASENVYTTIATLQSPAAYGMHSLTHDDDLSNIPQGLIDYRFVMSIASDTTFTLDSVTINHAVSCNGVVPVNNVVVIQPQTGSEVSVVINRLTPAKVNLVIFNAAGQKAFTRQFQQGSGTRTEVLDLNRILASRGVYYLSVFVDNKKEITREILRP